MDTDTLSQLGVGGLIAYLIVREVLGFLKGRSKGDVSDRNSTEPPIWAEALVVRVKEIYISHDKLDATLQRLVENAERQTLILERLTKAVVVENAHPVSLKSGWGSSHGC